MGKLEHFKVDLKSLKGEVTDFDYSIDDDFFAAVGGSEVSKGSLSAHLTVRKSAGVYDILFHVEGMVNVTCDLCLDDMSLPIEADHRLVARLGDTYREDDELIIVPSEEGILDVSWLLYEMIALAVPIRHVHEEGGCNEQMISRLKDLSASADSMQEATDAIDPRWKELEKLKTIIKD